MRTDFPSLLVERARYERTRVHPKGARVDVLRSLNPIDLGDVLHADEEDDDSVYPTVNGAGLDFDINHQSMSAPWRHHRKEKRIHLAPLRRYLHAQVGRPWNDVFSDVCHTLQSVASDGVHLTNYVDGIVELNVRVRRKDGELISERGYSVGSNNLYVHPETGILSLSPTKPRLRWKSKPRFEMVVIDNEHKLVKLDGHWFVVTLATIPGAEVGDRPVDVVLGREVTAYHAKYTWGNELYDTWGPGLYACHKRQANSREIRRLIKGLADESGDETNVKGNSKRKAKCYRPQGRR